MKINNPVFLSILAVVVLLLPATQLSASEFRTTDDNKFNLYVSWLTHPVFEDEINGITFHMNQFDEFGYQQPVGVLWGDTININVTAIFYESDMPGAEVIASTLLTVDPDSPAAAMNYSFEPTRYGAYGFHIQGEINGDPLDELFVCGAGSQAPTGSIPCVKKRPLKFPGKFKPGSDRRDDK